MSSSSLSLLVPSAKRYFLHLYSNVEFVFYNCFKFSYHNSSKTKFLTNKRPACYNLCFSTTSILSLSIRKRKPSTNIIKCYEVGITFPSLYSWRKKRGPCLVVIGSVQLHGATSLLWLGGGRKLCQWQARKKTETVLHVASPAAWMREGRPCSRPMRAGGHLSGKYFSASPERAVQLKSLYMRFLLLHIIVALDPTGTSEPSHL